MEINYEHRSQEADEPIHDTIFDEVLADWLKNKRLINEKRAKKRSVSMIKDKQTIVTSIDSYLGYTRGVIREKRETYGIARLPRTASIYGMTLRSEECRGWISSRRAYRLINRLSFRPAYVMEGTLGQ